MANKLFQNSLEYDGLSKSDEMVLSVSVDRPTFFNFLNPNRSFFLNLQMFIRYLPDYEGGSKHNDGMYGSARGPVTGNIVFTFFTGYFQDRLAPRVSLLYAPFESQGAAITALSYRWNDAFSTTIGYTQFFGHVYRQQGVVLPDLAVRVDPGLREQPGHARRRSGSLPRSGGAPDSLHLVVTTGKG